MLFVLSCFAFAQNGNSIGKEAEAARQDAAAKRAIADEAKKQADAVKEEIKPRACVSTCEVKWNETQRKKIAAAVAEANKKEREAKIAELKAEKTETAPVAPHTEPPAALPIEPPVATEEPVAAEPAPVAGFDIAMILVKGSTFFTMGCTKEQGADCNDDERPAHNVTLSDFYISKSPVTQKLWENVMGANPSRFKGANLPVESVSWNDAQEFIKKLNAMSGKKYRLPTETEWEFAARGGIMSLYQKFSGSNNLNAVAWHNGNSGQRTQPVCFRQPNELGICDMSGNVWEWVQDWKDNYSSTGLKANPAGPASGINRAYRGGSWQDGASYCRVSKRGSATPDSRSSTLGFRLVLDK